MELPPQLHNIVRAQPWPLVFATISGAHLYGFPSPDSDFDLRGAHVLPVRQCVGLVDPVETLEDSRIIDGLEMDIVSHDIRKFCRLLLRKNGYVLEQVLSPPIAPSLPACLPPAPSSPAFFSPSALVPLSLFLFLAPPPLFSLLDLRELQTGL